jgi:ketosteroid isomerase-like protein
VGHPEGVSEAQDEDVRLVLESYEAYARGDIAGAVAHLHPEVEWFEPDEFPDGGRHVGPMAVADYLTASRERWQQLRSMPLARRRGERIVVEHLIEGVLADGTVHSVTVADVYTMRDGQVVHMRAYADPADVSD